MNASPPLPPAGARLLSDMGFRRGRRTGEQTFHAGMDLGHPDGRGTPVLNVKRGTVERILQDSDRRPGFGGYGNGVIVYHPDEDVWTLYAHLDRVDVTQGQEVEPGSQVGTMGNSSNRKFPGMGVHLHFEVRRRTRAGRSPFPGPYRTNNIDPRPWLAERGLAFGQRGAFEIQPDSRMAATRHLWENLGAFGTLPLKGIDPYPPQTIEGMRFPSSALSDVDMDAENEYEPVKFDRDVLFGLTPIEWGVVGAGALVVTGTAVGLLLRYRLRKPKANRRRRR